MITTDKLKALGFTPNRQNQLSKELWDPSVHIELITADSEGNHYFSITQQPDMGEEQTFHLRSMIYMTELKLIYLMLSGKRLE